jgi:hypothetical protein
MLLSPDTFEIIKEIPHKKEYEIWRSRLTAGEYDDLIKVLSDHISGDRILTSSWIPGRDWTGTPYQIIYEKACQCNQEHAAWFFGLILWDTIMRHSDIWSFAKSANVKGTTYFKVDISEERRRELFFKYA